jgi:glycosyltransferase involved in cell wall biosynthesis
MRIAWLIQELKKGGGHRVCVEMSKELTRRGHQVTILVPKGRLIAKPPEPIQVIECGTSIANPMKSIPLNGPAILRNIPPADFVFSTMPYMGIINTIATWLRPVRGVHFIMADDYHLFNDRSLIKSSFFLALHKLTVLISYRLPVLIIANSSWTRERVAAYGPRPKYILRPGVNLEWFKPAKRKIKQTGTFKIAAMPRKHPMKGWPMLADALNRLWEQRRDFQVLAITQDTLSYENCHFPVKSVAPEDDAELVRYLRNADLFAAPSTSEGIPLPPLEAMACGVPVVGTNIGGIREYAVHNENSWLVPVNSPTDMKTGINHLLDNPDLRNKLRANGLETAKRFSWTAYVDELLKILDRESGNN